MGSDRRCYHAGSPNLHPPDGPTRYVAFYGFSYRWLRPKNDHDHTQLDAFPALCGPVRRQLLGAQPSGSGGTFDPKQGDAPLEHVAEELGLLWPADAPADATAELAAGAAELAAENAALRAENAALREVARL